MIELFETKDLYLASAIYAWGEKEFSLKRNGSFFLFVFKNRKRCQQLANDYWAERGKISPKRYVDAMQTIKNRLFEKKEMNHEKSRLYPSPE